MPELELPESLSRKITDVRRRPLNGGDSVRVRFANGYGASVVSHPYSYGGSHGLFELAVLARNSEELDYTTPVTNDVEGHLTTGEVHDMLEHIASLDELALERHQRGLQVEQLTEQYESIRNEICDLAGFAVHTDDPEFAPFEVRTALRAVQAVYKARVAELEVGE